MTPRTGNCVPILFRKHILVYKCKIPDLLKLLLWKLNDGVPKPPVLGSRPNLSWLTTASAFIYIHGILQTSRNVSKHKTWVQTVEGLVILMTTNNLPTYKLDPHTSTRCSETSLFVTWMISEFLWSGSGSVHLGPGTYSAPEFPDLHPYSYWLVDWVLWCGPGLIALTDSIQVGNMVHFHHPIWLLESIGHQVYICSLFMIIL